MTKDASWVRDLPEFKRATGQPEQPTPLSVADARTALFRWVGEGETAYTSAVDALIAAVKREAEAETAQQGGQ